jgi:hypothetical protein
MRESGGDTTAAPCCLSVNDDRRILASAHHTASILYAMRFYVVHPQLLAAPPADVHSALPAEPFIAASQLLEMHRQTYFAAYLIKFLER